MLEQSSLDCELHWSHLHGKGTPERSSSGVLEPRWSNFSLENPASERNPGIKGTRIGAIFLKSSIRKRS
jgi:hypothetical protein